MIPRSDKIFLTAMQANRTNGVVGESPPLDSDRATCIICPSDYRRAIWLHLESSVLADKFEFGFMESVET
jgi:hypothetical protein